MASVKTLLLQELENARNDLWHTLNLLDDATEIYPEWKKREFLAHIAGWEAMVFEVIYCHMNNQVTIDYMYTGIDNANARFVLVRKSSTVQDAKLECDINRFAIQTLLERIENFDEVIHFPWGKNSVAEFVQGAIQHERNHLNDIVQLL